MNAPNTLMSGPGQDLAIDDATFRTIARLVHDVSGIVLTEAKKGLVVSRLARRLRHLGLPDYSAYCRFVESRDGVEERQHLISALTTNVTRFFREDHHFVALQEEILPPLIERARNGGRLRIWSAGCSTGEEPYSLAIRVLEACPDAARYDIRILATDLDPAVIARARSGRYPDIHRNGVPKSLEEKYFRRPDAENNFEVSGDLRRLITFAELNLMGDWPMSRSFDIIFCRNVVIYFDAETQDRLWQRFAALLPPGGHLFIGHSERVGREAQTLLVSAGITQYRRTEAPSDLPLNPPSQKGVST